MPIKNNNDGNGPNEGGRLNPHVIINRSMAESSVSAGINYEASLQQAVDQGIVAGKNEPQKQGPAKEGAQGPAKNSKAALRTLAVGTQREIKNTLAALYAEVEQCTSGPMERAIKEGYVQAIKRFESQLARTLQNSARAARTNNKDGAVEGRETSATGDSQEQTAKPVRRGVDIGVAAKTKTSTPKENPSTLKEEGAQTDKGHPGLRH